MPKAIAKTTSPADRTVKSPPRPTARVVPQAPTGEQPSRFRAMMAKLLGKKQGGQPATTNHNVWPPAQSPSIAESKKSGERTLMAKLLGKKTNPDDRSIGQGATAIARTGGRTSKPATAVAAAKALPSSRGSLATLPVPVDHADIADSLVVLPPDDEPEAVSSARLAGNGAQGGSDLARQATVLEPEGPNLGDPMTIRMDATLADATAPDAALPDTMADSSSELDEPALDMAELSAHDEPFVDNAVIPAAFEETVDQSVNQATLDAVSDAQPPGMGDAPSASVEPSSIATADASPQDGSVQLVGHTQAEARRVPLAASAGAGASPAPLAVVTRWSDVLPKDPNRLTWIGIVVLSLLVVLLGMRRRPTIHAMPPVTVMETPRPREIVTHGATGMLGAMTTVIGLAIVAVGAMAVVRGHWGDHPLLYRPGLMVAAVGQVILLGGIVMLAGQGSRATTVRTTWEADIIESQLDRLRGAVAATAGGAAYSPASAWPAQPSATGHPNVSGQIAQLKAQLACLAQQLDHLSPSGRGGDGRTEQ